MFFSLGVLVAAGDVITPSNLVSEAAQIMTARMGVVGLVIGPVLRS